MNYDNVSVDERVVFFEQNHIYKLLSDPSFKFTSVTTLIKEFYEPFDAVAVSEKVTKMKTSVFYGKDPEILRKEWSEKARVASEAGTILHAYGEDLLNKKEVEAPDLIKAKWVPGIVTKLYNDGYELAKTELLVYSEDLQLAGQADIIFKKRWLELEDYFYSIYDWKFLGKKLEKKSYYNPYTRKYRKMLKPFHHLLDCNWIHYSIQLAIYQTLSGAPERVREKVLVVVYDESYALEPAYPMRVFWDSDHNLQAVYEIRGGKFYDSRTDKITKTWPKDIKGR